MTVHPLHEMLFVSCKRRSSLIVLRICLPSTREEDVYVVFTLTVVDFHCIYHSIKGTLYCTLTHCMCKQNYIIDTICSLERCYVSVASMSSASGLNISDLLLLSLVLSSLVCPSTSLLRAFICAGLETHPDITCRDEARLL